MLWTRITKHSTLLLLIFSFLFFVTRIPGLATDAINPDAVNWHYRTEQFVNGLKYQQWEKTYQHYHPGVTMMWITGFATEGFKQITGIKSYNIYNFEAFDFISKYALVFVQLVLSIYIIFILRKYFGMFGSMLLVSIFTFEPWFVGNSRLYHLDVLLALLVFAGLITGYLAVQRNSMHYYFATGFLLSLAFLTKSIAILAIGFYGLWFIVEVLLKRRDFAKLKGLLLVCGVFVLTTFVFFPALWVNPVYYIGQIFAEADRVGFRRGHEQVVFGNVTQDASIWFYLIVLVLKSSPLLISGAAIYFLYSFKLRKKYQDQINQGFIIYLGMFALLYLVVISLASKKIDRYDTLLYPFLAVFSYYGYLALSELKGFRVYLTAMVVGFIVFPLFSFYPYYFTYASPLFGSPENANNIIGQKPFGVGVRLLKNTILKEFGYKNLGFIDTKPMEAIYANSKVFDIRVNGVSDFDLIVLGINEVMPNKVTNNTNFKFIKTSSVYINGLEFWRIYEKR